MAMAFPLVKHLSLLAVNRETAAEAGWSVSIVQGRCDQAMTLLRLPWWRSLSLDRSSRQLPTKAKFQL
jgi:hypothetical protein